MSSAFLERTDALVQRHGRGTYRDTQGNVYEGEYKNGQREGQGTLRLNDRVYTGFVLSAEGKKGEGCVCVLGA